MKALPLPSTLLPSYLDNKQVYRTLMSLAFQYSTLWLLPGIFVYHSRTFWGGQPPTDHIKSHTEIEWQSYYIIAKHRKRLCNEHLLKIRRNLKNQKIWKDKHKRLVNECWALIYSRMDRYIRLGIHLIAISGVPGGAPAKLYFVFVIMIWPNPLSGPSPHRKIFSWIKV